MPYIIYTQGESLISCESLRLHRRLTSVCGFLPMKKTTSVISVAKMRVASYTTLLDTTNICTQQVFL